MKLAVKKGIWILMALGWWGVLYPELSLLEDGTYRIIYVDEKGENLEEKLSATELYYKLLKAEPDKIKVKSKVLETVLNFWDKSNDKVN